MFRLVVAISLASEIAVDAILHARRASLHRGLVPNGTTVDKQQPRFTCTPPESFLQLVRSSGNDKPKVVMVSSSHAVYTADDGDEVNLFAYDCTKQVRLIFLHLPKNAGTTLEDLGNKEGVSWGRFELTGTQYMGEGKSCSKWHVPPSMLEGVNPYEGSEVFCVTRDPWERTVSEYVYRLMLNQPWHHILDGPRCTREGFNAFVTRALADLEAGHGRFDLDCHLLPQWDYVEGPDGHQWCTHLLPMKNLTNSFNSLMAEYGIPLLLPAHKKANSGENHCEDLDTDLEELYSQPAKTIMRRVYAEDFAHLGDSLEPTNTEDLSAWVSEVPRLSAWGSEVPRAAADYKS